MVIWGIRAERDSATGIDAVQEEVPVPDVDVLVSRLKELQPPATDPPIKAVIIHPLLLPNEAKKGFVVCFIPESDSKPHRSEFGKNEVKRFNLRIGDTTQECTVPILRQLFHPRVTLKAEMAVKSLNVPQRIGRLSVSEGNAGMLPASAMYAVHLGIKNIGRYSFHNASIGLDCGPASFLEYKFKNSFGEIDVEWIQDVVFLSTVLNPGRERNTPSSYSKYEQDYQFTIQDNVVRPRYNTTIGRSSISRYCIFKEPRTSCSSVIRTIPIVSKSSSHLAHQHGTLRTCRLARCELVGLAGEPKFPPTPRTG